LRLDCQAGWLSQRGEVSADAVPLRVGKTDSGPSAVPPTPQDRCAAGLSITASREMYNGPPTPAHPAPAGRRRRESSASFNASRSRYPSVVIVLEIPLFLAVLDLVGGGWAM